MAAKKKMIRKTGGCHCKAVRFEVQVPDEIELIACNCTLCAMTGYQHLVVPKSRFRLLKGKTKLTTYTFNTETAKHFFCSVCGIKSFYVPRSHPDGYSINFRCLDDQDFHSVLTVDFDGKNWEQHIEELAPLKEEADMASQILMPALSPTMEEGKLAKWLVKEGDAVKSGDILAEIETDKATMEFEAVDEGKIGRILVPEGTEGVKVNQPIATLLADGEAPGAEAPADIPSAMASIKDAVVAESGRASAAPSPRPSPPKGERGSTEPSPPGPSRGEAIVASIPLSPIGGEGKRDAPASRAGEGMPTIAPSKEHPSADHCIFASPLAKRIAAQSGLDLSAVNGSGPRGRIVKADVEAAAKSGVAKAPAKPAAQPAAAPAQGAAGPSGIAPLPDAKLFFKPDDYVEVPHNSMRKAIARRLASAKTLIPHFYLTIDCRIDELMAMRARLNERAPKGEGAYKLSVNDFVVKACALALLRVPEVNASWTENAILRHKHADIGVAVALDFGLITPIVFRAEEKGLAVISNEVKSLAERARTKKLKPQEFEGGTFAISNLGMFGIKDFTAVINPPHAAILAVGAGEARAVVRDGKVEAATVMTVTLSCDHRVIDGATGARFLQAFRTFIEDPAAMLL